MLIFLNTNFVFIFLSKEIIFKGAFTFTASRILEASLSPIIFFKKEERIVTTATLSFSFKCGNKRLVLFELSASFVGIESHVGFTNNTAIAPFSFANAAFLVVLYPQELRLSVPLTTYSPFTCGSPAKIRTIFPFTFLPS